MERSDGDLSKLMFLQSVFIDAGNRQIATKLITATAYNCMKQLHIYSIECVL